MWVRPATVSKWRKKLGLDAHASEIVRQELFGHLPEVYGVLVERARTGSIDHMKLLLEVAEGIDQYRKQRFVPHLARLSDIL